MFSKIVNHNSGIMFLYQIPCEEILGFESLFDRASTYSFTCCFVVMPWLHFASSNRCRTLVSVEGLVAPVSRETDHQVEEGRIMVIKMEVKRA